RLVPLIYDYSDKPQRPVRVCEPKPVDLVVRPRPGLADRLGEPRHGDVGRRRNCHIDVDDLDLSLDDSGYIHGYRDGDDRLGHPFGTLAAWRQSPAGHA